MTPKWLNFLFDICTRANTIPSYLPLRRKPRRSLLLRRLDMRGQRQEVSLFLIPVTIQVLAALAALSAMPAAMINSVHTIGVVVTVGIRAESLLARLAPYQTSLDLRHNF